MITTRRGQLHAMETILVTIILILIILFGIYFFSRATQVSIDETRHSFRLDAVQNTAVQLSSLPEIDCPRDGGESRACMDKLKLEILSAALNNPAHILYSNQNRLRYVELFGNTLITVEVLYPYTQKIILFNATTQENLLVQSLPINIYDAQNDTFAFGRLTVALE